MSDKVLTLKFPNGAELLVLEYSMLNDVPLQPETQQVTARFTSRRKTVSFQTPLNTESQGLTSTTIPNYPPPPTVQVQTLENLPTDPSVRTKGIMQSSMVSFLNGLSRTSTP